MSVVSAVETFKDLVGSVPSNVEIPLDLNAVVVASSWLARLADATARKAGYESIFVEESHWRDHIALTASLRSISSRPAVIAAWSQCTQRAHPYDFHLVDGTAQVIRAGPGLAWLQARYTFKTQNPPASCSGTFRLLPSADGSSNGYRAWIISSTVEALDGYEAVPTLKAPPVDLETVSSVEVLIIGAGQWGTQIGAHLSTFGIQHLIVDSNSAAGDSWRLRYDLLCLHTPQCYGHPAFMPYGKDIPEHVPTRLVGEQYRKLADHFQLPVLGNTTVTRARYSNSKWTVELTSPKGGRKIESTWLLLCTGAGSQQPWMPTIPGQNGFKGQVVHSSAYMNGEAWAGKKAIVVGTANSGHDMAQDLYLSGAASVTLVQREKTFVIAREHLGKLLGSLYNPNIPTHDADRYAYGSPLGVNRLIAQRVHRNLVDNDSERFDRLEAAGFGLHRYADLLSFTLGRGGGHYVDIGCSSLIADGKVKVKRGSPISSFTSTGVRFEDGTELEADIVVLATGFRDKNLRLVARDIIGDELADQISDVWNVNSEGEVKGVWRPCGHERFIITAGDVALSRFYSHIVAQQLLQSHYGVRLPAIDTPVADFAAAYHKCKVSISMNDGAAKREEQITPMIGATVSVGA